MHCLLLLMVMCHAVQDKPLMAVTAAQTAVMVEDGLTTRAVMDSCAKCYEGDPWVRPFIGRRPTWARMAGFGALQVVGQAWVGEKMRESSHKWVRRLAFLPQAAAAADNVRGIVINMRLLKK